MIISIYSKHFLKNKNSTGIHYKMPWVPGIKEHFLDLIENILENLQKRFNEQ